MIYMNQCFIIYYKIMSQHTSQAQHASLPLQKNPTKTINNIFGIMCSKFVPKKN